MSQCIDVLSHCGFTCTREWVWWLWMNECKSGASTVKRFRFKMWKKKKTVPKKGRRGWVCGRQRRKVSRGGFVHYGEGKRGKDWIKYRLWFLGAIILCACKCMQNNGHRVEGFAFHTIRGDGLFAFCAFIFCRYRVRCRLQGFSRYLATNFESGKKFFSRHLATWRKGDCNVATNFRRPPDSPSWAARELYYLSFGHGNQSK